MRRRPFLLLFVVIGLLSSLAVPIARAEDTPAVDPVPEPIVSGPVADEVGLKGEPWFDPPFVLAEAQPYPYVSEEFFVEGAARDLLGTGADAPYKTRILVVRPQNASDFSGTAVVEWDNVTAQAALNPLFMWDHPYLLREGHAFVSVSAQAAGVCCTPVSHTGWDPPRYGDLSHPGDAYSYDIYAQAIEALRRNTVSTDGVAGGIPNGGALTGALGNPLQTPIPGGRPVMGDLAVSNVIATGTSQSASRLHTYLDQIQGIHADNIDGVLLDAGGSRTYTRPPVIPTIHFLSEDGLSATEPNVGGASLMGTDNNYRLWEVPGASHADAEFSRYIEDGLYGTHILETPPLPWKQWDDRRFSFRYGDDGLSLRAGCQPLGYGDNTYPRRYAARAAMDQLVRWTTSDDAVAPPSTPGKGKGKGKKQPPVPTEFVAVQPPRVEYDAAGTEVRDANRQVVGGVRLPQIDVPVADYLATTCGLFGHTIGFDPITLSTLYPTTDAYVAQMHAAIDRALEVGVMLPPEADELRFQLESAVVPSYRAPKLPGASQEGAAHLLATLVGG